MGARPLHLGAFAAAALAPGAALAHAGTGGFVLLLPTGYWMAGGAAAVAASFLLLALSPGRGLARLFRACLTVPSPLTPPLAGALGWLSFGVFALLVAAGAFGSPDPLANPLPLTVWSVVWVGLTVLTAAVGNLWPVLNPWVAPLGLANRLGLGRRGALAPWAERLGHWPAVAGMLALGWFELVHLSPGDPGLLARLAAAYWTLTFALALIAGKGWLERGEVLGALYRLVGTLAPLSCRDGRLRLTLPGARLLDAAPLPPGAVALILAALATVSFDGLSRTFWWLSAIGINPLDFPGRSAVVTANGLGYAGAVAAMAAAFLGAVLLGRRIAPAPLSLRAEAGRLALSLLPIALAYHFSHYLPVLLVNGQYWLAAMGDPLGSGADLLGYGRERVTTSFLHRRAAVEAVWTAQAGAVIAGHLLAVLLAHLIALDLHGGARRRAALAQLPLAALMVGYTVLGLWLLSAPSGA